MRRLPSLTALRFFEETAKHLSFSQAAKALFVTQGAVSRQVKALEQTLGVTLFERHHHGLRLTSSGHSLLPWLTQGLDLIERGVRELDIDDGHLNLRLSAPPTFAGRWLSPRLGSLAAQMPHIDVSVLTTTNESCECRVRFGLKADTEGHSELLLMERHALMGPPWFAEMSLDTLLAETPLLHVLEGQERLAMWADWFDQAGFDSRERRRSIEFSTLEQAIQAARKGVGLALVDGHMVVEELAEGDLVTLSEVEVVGPYGYWLDIPQQSLDSGRVQAFAQWIRDEAHRAL